MPIALRDVKLEIDYQFDARRWIEGMSKPQAWKEGLLEMLDENQLWDYFTMVNYPKSLPHRDKLEAELYGIFQKDESYTAVTATRIIYALTDYHRIAHGDICKIIGEQLTHNQNTFSGVPVKEWAKISREIFNIPGKKARATDFSGFEKWFNSFIKHCVDYAPFALVAACNPEASARLEHMKQGELKHQTYRHVAFDFKAISDSQRSGSHKTYSVNTFGHWLLSCFMHYITTGQYPTLAPQLGVKNVNDLHSMPAPSVISGDDSKTAQGIRVDETFYEKVGLNVEYEPGEFDDDLQFCKTAPVVRSDGKVANMPPLWERLAALRWLPNRLSDAKTSKLIAMTRAKCLSYLYQYPSAPILSVICDKFLMATTNVDMRVARKHLDMWTQKKLDEALRFEKEAVDALKKKPQGTIDAEAGLHHPFYQNTDPLEFAAVSKAYGIPVDLQERFHQTFEVRGDFSTPACALLLDCAREQCPSFILNTTLYGSTHGESQNWIAPTPGCDRIQQLRIVLLLTEADEASFLRLRALEAELPP